MRDYDDDNIRLYTPVLQRVIILAAVIIAVPVVMWTITTFVRSYVAPPKAPTFQRMTENAPPQNAAVPAAGAPAPAVPQAEPPAPPLQTAVSGAAAARRTLVSITKPAAGDQAAAPEVAAPAAAPQIATAPPPPAIQPMAAAPAAPIAAPVSAAPAPATPPMAPPPPSAATPDAAAKASAGAPASDHGYAWPNPNTNAPPDLGMDNGAGRKLAAQEPPAASDTATQDLAPGEPIAGPIPLPRRRPNEVAMLQTTTVVPLPRERPADAPAATPSSVIDTPPYGYNPGLGH